MESSTIRITQDFTDAIMDMLCSDFYMEADGTYKGHVGHGGMWNSEDCTSETFITNNDDTVEVEAHTWIYPCNPAYDCPYLNTIAPEMCEYIHDEDGEEAEDWEAPCEWHVKVTVTPFNNIIINVYIENGLEGHPLIVDVYQAIASTRAFWLGREEDFIALLERVRTAIKGFSGEPVIEHLAHR